MGMTRANWLHIILIAILVAVVLVLVRQHGVGG